ncbi:MAG: three-Cys-motif partner protein TcmP [Terriglobia bacterium]
MHVVERSAACAAQGLGARIFRKRYGSTSVPRGLNRALGFMTKHSDLGVEERFFDHPTESSRVKQRVVVDYFLSWANVLARDRTVGYADLFAGPGKYKSGERSIPLLVTERVIQDERLRKWVRLWFNEGDEAYARQLKSNVLSLPGINTLRYRPAFTKKIVDKSLASHRFTIPTLVFADPCGYRGLSLELICNALRGFGNDCLFFFNYRRINMKLSYPVMDESIDEFFEAGRARALRQEIAALRPRAREAAVLNAIRAAIQNVNGIPVVFAFRSREGGGTSHHLIFASKHSKGAGIMKRIMSACSSEVIDGIGSWDFDPKAAETTPLLFSPLDQLCERLLEVFAGRTLTFEKLLDEEALETQYTDSNYRDAVLRLESEFRVATDPPGEARRMQPGSTKRTLPPATNLVFPS